MRLHVDFFEFFYRYPGINMGRKRRKRDMQEKLEESRPASKPAAINALKLV
jgi:hypothetical protein